jgi:hypothetical protein
MKMPGTKKPVVTVKSGDLILAFRVAIARPRDGGNASLTKSLGESLARGQLLLTIDCPARTNFRQSEPFPLRRAKRK